VKRSLPLVLFCAWLLLAPVGIVAQVDPTETPAATETITPTATATFTPTATPTTTPTPTQYPQGSGHVYWPQTAGNSIQYNVFIFSGSYNPSTMWITANSVTYVANRIISTSFEKRGFVSFVHEPSAYAFPPTMSAAQINGTGFGTGKCFLGEVTNEWGMTIYPPEPKITCNPIVGESFDVWSTVFNGSSVFSFQTRYKTLVHYDTAASFKDVWVTSLIEIGNPSWVVNYYFAKNIGIVIMLYGRLNADNTMSGVEWFKNP